jgi:hypothetical protein
LLFFCAMATYTFRLTNTPLGTLLVKFYQIEPYSEQAFQREQARDFLNTTTVGLGSSWGLSLYQGLVDNNLVLPEAILRLHVRCPECNCVRIERGG